MMASYSSYNYSKKTTLIINLYNLLIIHSIISNGFPSFSRRLNFLKKSVYNVGSLYFSLLELEFCIIRSNSTAPTRLFGTNNLTLPQFSSRDKRKQFSLNKDFRFNFVI